MIVQEINEKLKGIYGSSIYVQISTSTHRRIQASIKKVDHIEMAILIHMGEELAMVWNVGYRKEQGWGCHTVPCEKDWRTLSIENHEIKTIYKEFKTSNGKQYEKVLVLDIYTLLN